MERDEIRTRRDALVRDDGPWTMANIRLADGVHTIGDGDLTGAAGIRRVVQVVRDVTGGRLTGRRVLDAGCGEGAIAVELARQGAEVVALDGSQTRVAKAQLAKEALDLKRLTVVRADAATISSEALGFFDVVIALHLLCELDAPSVFEVASRLGAVATDVAIVSARLAPRARQSWEHAGMVYRGMTARGRGPGPRPAFLLTRPSFLNLLTRAGFTSIAEIQDPDADERTPLWLALKGRRVALHTQPQANVLSASSYPEARSTLRSVLRRRGR